MKTDAQGILGRTGAAALALLLLAASGAAVARNDQLILPIERAMSAEQSAYKISPDVRLKFGKDSAGEADPAQPVLNIEGSANPFLMNDLNNGGRRTRMSDEAACIDAFRRAVVNLQQQARLHKSSYVVGIVSNYHGKETGSAGTYECRIGHTRSQVDLQGRPAKQP
jgi:hypothetical protein